MPPAGGPPQVSRQIRNRNKDPCPFARKQRRGLARSFAVQFEHIPGPGWTMGQIEPGHLPQLCPKVVRQILIDLSERFENRQHEPVRLVLPQGRRDEGVGLPAVDELALAGSERWIRCCSDKPNRSPQRRRDWVSCREERSVVESTYAAVLEAMHRQASPQIPVRDREEEASLGVVG